MYVYIYCQKTYHIVKSTQIIDFEYEEIGNQSKKFSSKPFKCLINKKSYICQILSVADTQKELNDFIQDKRPRVPKLNQSDLIIEEENDEMTEKQKLKQSRKKDKGKKKKSEQRAIDNIVAQYEQVLEPMDDNFEPQLTNANNINEQHSADDEIDQSTTATSTNKSIVRQYSALPEETDAGPSNSNDYEVNENSDSQNVLSALKKKLLEEKKERLKATKVANILREQNEKLKRQNEEDEHEKEADRAQIATVERLKDIKGYPKIINTQSGIVAKESAIEQAYTQKEPSRFYINMMYAIWGRSKLAERCIKKTKKNKDSKILTPKKKRIVRRHFEHFLSHYKYPETLYNHYLGLMNNYARRAINGAKAHVKMVFDTPELSSDQEDCEMTEV